MIGGEIYIGCDGEEVLGELVPPPKPSPFRYERGPDGELTKQSCHLATEVCQIEDGVNETLVALQSDMIELGWVALPPHKHLCPACAKTYAEQKTKRTIRAQELREGDLFSYVGAFCAYVALDDAAPDQEYVGRVRVDALRHRPGSRVYLTIRLRAEQLVTLEALPRTIYP